MNERIDKVEFSSQKGQLSKGPNVQKRANLYRYIDEDDYKEDLDEENHAPHINLSRFGWRNRNKKARYGDRVDNNSGNIKSKIPSFQGKNDHEAYLESKKRGGISIWLSQLLLIGKAKVDCR